MRQLSRLNAAISRGADNGTIRVLREPILRHGVQTSHHGVRVHVYISVTRTVSVASLQTRRLVLTPQLLSLLLGSFRSRRERFMLYDARLIRANRVENFLSSLLLKRRGSG